MARIKKPKAANAPDLKRINDLLNRCHATLQECKGLGDCHLDLDEERTKCEEQIQILTALKRKFYPDEQ